MAVFEDISKRIKTQQELSKADKLESLGVLAGGIAHDFNNVLGALIKDTAEFALRGATTKAEFVIPDSLWTASIDEGQISQVIYNLVINAKQAMPRGGIIRLSAENIVLDVDSLFNPGNYVKITIQVQGIGIPKENLAKIFDPFFTTKKEGNGLGLATSYSIIRHHEGYIDVESQEGMGTTFHVYLPALNGIAASLETRMGVVSKPYKIDELYEVLQKVVNPAQLSLELRF